MSEKTNISTLSDTALIEMLGAFIKHNRLEQNKTQAQLAEAAGVNRSNLAEFENGKRANLTTFIQLLRALNLLYTLEQFQIQFKISPLQLAKLEQEKRQRASKAKKAVKKPKSSW